MQIDGDARAAARREAKGESIVYRRFGEDFVFPVEYPLSAADISQTALDDLWNDDKYIRAWLQHLMGDEAWQRLVAHKPSVNDVADMYDVVHAAYGLSPGESASSSDSSATDGESSKPSSSGSTASTRGRSTPAKQAVRAVS